MDIRPRKWTPCYRVTICLCVFLSLWFAVHAAPIPDVAEDRGAMGLSQVLKRLDVVGSVLHTGAHPDDENGQEKEQEVSSTDYEPLPQQA